MVVIETSFGDRVEVDDDTAWERGWEKIEEAGVEERIKDLLSRAEKAGVSTDRVKKAILHLGAALTALESESSSGWRGGCQPRRTPTGWPKGCWRKKTW